MVEEDDVVMAEMTLEVPYRGETALLNPDMAPCREGAEAGGCSVRGRVGRCGA